MHADALLVGSGGIGRLLADYAHDQHRRGLAASTVRTRQQRLRLFHRQTAGAFYNTTAEQVQDFLDRRQVNPRTRTWWISMLHRFYSWSIDRGLTDLDPTLTIIRPRLARLLPRPASEEALAAGLHGASPRMAAWITLAAYSGLRCAEIANLERHAIIDGEMLRILGKGNRERTVPIHPLVAAVLDQHGLPRHGPVFVSAKTGTALDPKVVSRLGAQHMRNRGHDVTLHMFRHRFGTMTYRGCQDLRVVQELMGHSTPVVTAGYAAFGADEATRAVAALPAPSSD